MSLAAAASRASGTHTQGVLPSLAEGAFDLGIEWDAENRLTAVKQGGNTLASFTYGAKGQRATKAVGGVTTTYVYDQGNILEERLSTGGTLRYAHGRGVDHVLASQDQGGAVSYFLADHLGSIVQTTNASGQVGLVREYDPWGNLLVGATTSGYAFTGREWDAETSLHYYRARYYDARSSRFISEDPVGLRGRDPNFYSYVSNHPVVLVDPSGLLKDPCRLVQGQTLASVGDPTDPANPTIRGCVGLTLFHSWYPTARWPEDKGDCGYATLQEAARKKCKDGKDPFVFAHQYKDESTKHTTGEFNYVTFGSKCQKCFYATEGGWDATVVIKDCSDIPSPNVYRTTVWCRQCCGE